MTPKITHSDEFSTLNFVNNGEGANAERCVCMEISRRNLPNGAILAVGAPLLSEKVVSEIRPTGGVSSCVLPRYSSYYGYPRDFREKPLRPGGVKG